MRVLFALALVAGLVLSGCAGRDAPPAPTTGTPMGQIVGRVLDDARAPIRDAEVRVLLAGLVAHTDEAGEYELLAVPAGPVRLVASADGFTSQTRSGDLREGQVLRVDFELAATSRVVPYMRTLTFAGKIDCGLPQGLACPREASGATGANATHRFEVEPFLTGMVVQVRWTPPAQQVNERLAVDIQSAGAQVCGQTYQNQTGPSVLRMEVRQGFPISGGPQCLQVRAPDEGAVVQQEYEAFVSLFYHEAPPPGFSAIES